MADVKVWVEGNRVVVEATFRTPGPGEDVSDPSTWTAKTDPGTVTFTLRRLGTDVVRTVYVYGVASEITRAEQGVFRLNVLPDEGRYWCHVQGTAPAHGAGEIGFHIEASKALA